MIWNYLKIAFRNFGLQSSYSFINLSGLSVGIAATLLISLYSVDIITQDDCHKNKDKIFLIYKNRFTPDGTQSTYDTWVPLSAKLKEQFPDVIASARSTDARAKVYINGEYFDETVTYSDESFFDIFSFEFEDQKDKRFDNMSSVVVSASIAKKYFGEKNPIGEKLELFLTEEDTVLGFYISSVFKDLPGNSSINSSMVIQMESLPVYNQLANNWSSSFLSTWILLNEPGNKIYLESAFPDLIQSIWDIETSERTQFKLLALEEYYDVFLGNKQDAWIMLYIAFGILTIASINYMNMSTARSSYRSKEIGLRKVLGAVSIQIRIQFLIESILFILISVFIGSTLVFFSLPFMNSFFELSLEFGLLISPVGLGILLIISFVVGILSGIYPAFYLSSISIIHVMRKAGFGRGSRNIRNGLIVIQFSVAVLLISASFMVRNQLQYMYNTDMGFNEEQLIFIEASSSDFTDREIGTERLSSFKNTLKGFTFINGISASRHIPTDWSTSFTFVRPVGWTGDPLRMRYTYMDASFFNTYGIKFTQGHNFLSDTEGDQRESVILNESAYHALSFDTAAFPAIAGGQSNIQVVGVIKDFHYETMRAQIQPTLHFHRTMDHPVHNYITCKIDGSSFNKILPILEEEWSKLGATSPFRYSFADDSVQEMYTSEKQFLGLMSFFTLISVFIACMGLYAMTVFVVEKKRKEITIRKVVGAELSEILKLILFDFVVWILLAIVIGGGIAYFYFENWIDNFHYQAPISLWNYILTIIITITLVLFTVGFHAIKAGLANPITYLRED